MAKIMNLIESLPEDVIIVLTETLSRVSKISIVVFARVNKLCYRVSSNCAIQHKINRLLRCGDIAMEGSLEVLKWARSEGCSWDSYTCERAAKNGHFEILKWVRSEGCPWDSDTCSSAAQNGHLEVLKWARSEGCPWDSYTCSWAAWNEHLEVLKWAKLNGCEWTPQTEDFVKRKWPNIFS
jgi:hypothetical protein